MKLDFQVDRIQSLAEQKKVDIVPTITMYQDILHEEKKLTKYGDRCAPKFSLCKGIVFNFENYRTRFDKREAYDRFVITKPGQIKPPIHELIDRFDEYAGLKTATTTMTGAFKSARTSPRQTSNLLTALKTERLNSQASKKEESQMNISYRKLTQRSDSGTDIRVELLENFKRAHIPTQDLNTNDENFKTTEIRFEEGDTHRQSEDVTTEVDGEKFHRRHSSMKDVIPQDFYKDFAEMSQLNTMLPRLEAFPSRSQSISLKTIYRPPKDTAANTHSTLSTAARMMMSNRFSLSTTHAEFEEMMNNNSPSTKKFDSLDYVKKVKQQAFERRSKSVTKGKLKNELSRDLMITRKEINPLYAC